MQAEDRGDFVSGRPRAWIDTALTAVFLAALAAPTLDEFVRPPDERGPEKAEMRAAAARPNLYAHPGTIKHFPRRYEAWYRDTFGLRDVLLRHRSIARLLVFGVSSTEEIELGRDGWMFYTGEASRDVHRGRKPLPERELERWQAMFENHAEVCEQLGAAHVFVFGPTKETIYPEMAPQHWSAIGPSRLEQLDHWLTDRGATTRFLDLRPALLAEKARDLPGDYVYYELGTHWNGRGVYTAYREILASLAPRFPSLTPLPMEAFTRVLADNTGDSWARMMYVDDLVPQKSHVFNGAPTRVWETHEQGTYIWISESEDTSLPRAVMFHDSFGQSIQFQLAPHFSRLAAYWTGKVSDEIIARERADVVLEVYVERNLVSFAPRKNMIGSGNLSKGPFERSKNSLFVLTPGNVGTLAGRGGARVEAGDAPVLARVELPTPASLLELPGFPLSADGDLFLRIEIETASPGELVVLPIRTGETEPRRKQTGKSPYAAGTNAVYVRVPRSDGLARLALRFRQPGGGLNLRSLEVRGLPGL